MVGHGLLKSMTRHGLVVRLSGICVLHRTEPNLAPHCHLAQHWRTAQAQAQALQCSALYSATLLCAALCRDAFSSAVPAVKETSATYACPQVADFGLSRSNTDLSIPARHSRAVLAKSPAHRAGVCFVSFLGGLVPRGTVAWVVQFVRDRNPHFRI